MGNSLLNFMNRPDELAAQGNYAAAGRAEMDIFSAVLPTTGALGTASKVELNLSSLFRASKAGAVPNSASIPLKISDDAFVRFDPIKFDVSIDDVGLKTEFSNGKLWFTKYGDVKNITNATDLEQVLYRKNLWSGTEGKFTDGATLRLLTNVPDAVPAGLTNMTNGVRQWRVVRDIPSTDLQTIMQLKGEK